MQQIGEARVNKSDKIGNLRAKGRPDVIWGTGTAECAGRAETLELINVVDISPARFTVERGRWIEALHAHSAEPQHFETSAGSPASVSVCVFVYVYV